MILILLLLLTFPVLLVSQRKAISLYKKKILILDRTDLSTEKSQGFSKAILKTQLESERVMGDFNSKESYYFFTHKELRIAMTKAKVTQKDFNDPGKVLNLGWILKADLIIMSSYRVTGDRVQVQLNVLSVKEERILLTYTSKPSADVYAALDLFMIKHYKTIEKAPNLPSIDPSRLLILDLADESGVSNYRYLSKRIPEIMKDNLLDARDYNIVPRSRFLKVMKRRTFENPDLKEKKNALSIARELGAAIVIYGTYKKQGDEVLINITIMDVETGRILFRRSDQNIVSQKEISELTQDFIAEESKRPKSVFKTLPEQATRPSTSSRMALRVGFPIIFGHNETVIQRKRLSFSLFWRDRFLGDDLYYEIDLSYFAYENKVTVTAGMSETHNFPITFNMLYSLKLSRFLRVNPTVGVGYMLAYGTSTLLGDRLSSFLVMKPALEMEWTLSRRFSIHLGGDMLMTVPLKGSGITYFLIPNMGVSYGF
ncbi:MAG: hypothetical protein IEMM0008_0446 [bacterium]|nr:MAG: hypothetical protein IEMM0008_0446 [bacterium]